MFARLRITALAFVLTALLPLPAGAATLNASGRIAVLRVHEVGGKYGPPTDQIDVEVVVTLQGQPGKAFGFQLRSDGNQPVRRGMLDLLRDAFANNWVVNVDYNIAAGKNNGIIIRVWLSK
jgi:hypothetical protein